jgi:hypothetical protein
MSGEFDQRALDSAPDDAASSARSAAVFCSISTYVLDRLRDAIAIELRTLVPSSPRLRSE